MSRTGAPTLSAPEASELRVGVVAALWHPEIVDGLVAGAQRALTDAKVRDPVLLRVPGSFELPVAAARLARHGYDTVVCLGVVVRGATPHFEYVCQAATWGLTQVSIVTGVPVGFGVLTCDTVEQARERCGLPGSVEDKGYEAAHAALATASALRAVFA